LANMASGGMGLLFPPLCTHCQADIAEPQDGPMLCQECCRRLAPEKWIGCRHCGGVVSEELESQEHCHRCKKTPLRFDKVVTLGGYLGELREVILRMKHSRNEYLSLAIGGLFAQKRLSELADLHAEMIVPVPMYWTRRLRRGTNSPELLARCLGDKLGIPVQRSLLVRSKNTLPQVGLSPKERFHNMRGAFRVRSGRPLQGARILLVDDVLTTGATGSEAAKALKKAGASMVAVAVVARAQGGE
jgi:ComF family protein